MDSHFRHRSSADDDLNSSLSQATNEFLKLGLLGLRVFLKLIGGLEENGSLSLSLVHLDISIENSNLGLLNSVNRGQAHLEHNHSLDDLRVLDTTSENLLDPNVVNVELSAILREGGCKLW